MKKLLVWLGFLLLTTGLTKAQESILRVEASRSLGTISPYVYGANLGQQSVVPPDLMPQAQALGLNYIRYGGGDSDRRDLLETTVDLFIYQVRQIGAEPAITVRLLGGTPEQAADMVRYANIEKNYAVRYWSIGNEPNIYQDTMGVPYTTEDLNRDWRAIAEAMLAVDPDILLVGPDITQYVVLSTEAGNIQYLESADGGHPLDQEGRDWLQEFLRANGDLVDIVSIHRYPYPGAGELPHSAATIEGLRANSREWDISIPNLRQIIRDSAGRDIPIAVTEVNSNSSQSSGGEASLDSLYNAIWFADVLGRLIRQQVEIVAYWDLQGPINRSWGLLTRTGVRPTYYLYVMYSHFGTELLVSESTDPDVSIYAASRDDGTLTLMVINLGPDERALSLELDGFTPGEAAEVWRFDAEHNAEQIASEEIGDGATIIVPGQSITLYAVPGH
jgi:alpha-L-arabinofuranosidase